MGDCPIYANNSVTQRARPPPWGLTVSALVRWYYSHSKLSWKARSHRLTGVKASSKVQRIIGLSIALHPGFLILDSIHFQYNAFLFGLMIWSLVGAKEGKPIVCAGFFASLLMFK